MVLFYLVKSNLTCGETENKLENVNRQNSKNISLESFCMRSVLVSQQDQYEEKVCVVFITLGF